MAGNNKFGTTPEPMIIVLEPTPTPKAENSDGPQLSIAPAVFSGERSRILHEIDQLFVIEDDFIDASYNKTYNTIMDLLKKTKDPHQQSQLMDLLYMLNQTLLLVKPSIMMDSSQSNPDSSESENDALKQKWMKILDDYFFEGVETSAEDLESALNWFSENGHYDKSSIEDQGKQFTNQNKYDSWITGAANYFYEKLYETNPTRYREITPSLIKAIMSKESSLNKDNINDIMQVFTTSTRGIIRGDSQDGLLFGYPPDHENGVYGGVIIDEKMRNSGNGREGVDPVESVIWGTAWLYHKSTIWGGNKDSKKAYASTVYGYNAGSDPVNYVIEIQEYGADVLQGIDLSDLDKDDYSEMKISTRNSPITIG